MARAARRVLDNVATGSGLEFDVVAERALDIAGCRFRGAALGVGVAGRPGAPQFLRSRGARLEPRSFTGGLITTCGLDQFGAPAVDQGEPFGIHCWISNLPAEQAGYRTYWNGLTSTC